MDRNQKEVQIYLLEKREMLPPSLSYILLLSYGILFLVYCTIKNSRRTCRVQLNELYYYAVQHAVELKTPTFCHKLYRIVPTKREKML